MVWTPEHHRAGRPRCRPRRREEGTRGHRRHRRSRDDREPSSRRHREDVAPLPARDRRSSAGLDHADGSAAAEVPPAVLPPSPVKRPRLRSEVGLVRGCLRRFRRCSDDDDGHVDAVPDGAAVPTPASSSVAPEHSCCDDGVVFAPEAALPGPAEGGAGTAPSSSPAAPAAAPPNTTTGPFLPCQVPAPAPPPSSVAVYEAQLMMFTAAAAPPAVPAAPRPTTKRTKALPAAPRPAYRIPAIPPVPALAPPQQQHGADPDDELRRAKVQRYAGLIAKSNREIDDRFRESLRRGRAPPEPMAAADREALRRIAARDAARRRFREALGEAERKARGDALFTQVARREHLRALGIDRATERALSSDRPRDGNGAPVLSPEHPCSPLEKLGYFLKAE